MFWFVWNNVLKRPFRTILIILMGTVSVTVFLVILALATSGFKILERYTLALSPQTVIVIGPSLPVQPSQLKGIPYIKVYMRTIITDAYLICGSVKKYVIVVGYNNFTLLEKLSKISIINGTCGGLLIPVQLSNLAKEGEKCEVVLPFVGSYNISISGVVKAPSLEHLMGRSYVIFVPLSALRDIEYNSLVMMVDKTSHVTLVVKYLRRIIGDNGFIISRENMANVVTLTKIAATITSLFIGASTILIVSIAVTMLTVLDVKSRSWEFGLYKALGVTSFEIAVGIVLTVMLYSLVSIVIGSLIAMNLVEIARSMFRQSLLREGINISNIESLVSVNINHIIQVSGILIGMMIVGSLIPAVMVYKLDPVQALKSME